eukprot:4311516-Pleurochrysis_carterae.AAC.2
MLERLRLPMPNEPHLQHIIYNKNTGRTMLANTGRASLAGVTTRTSLAGLVIMLKLLEPERAAVARRVEK